MNNIILFYFHFFHFLFEFWNLQRIRIQALDLVFNSPKDLPSTKLLKIPLCFYSSKIWKIKITLLIVLEEINDNSYKWTSSNLIKIYTKNGIIIRIWFRK